MWDHLLCGRTPRGEPGGEHRIVSPGGAVQGVYCLRDVLTHTEVDRCVNMPESGGGICGWFLSQHLPATRSAHSQLARPFHRHHHTFPSNAIVDPLSCHHNLSLTCSFSPPSKLFPLLPI